MFQSSLLRYEDCFIQRSAVWAHESLRSGRDLYVCQGNTVRMSEIPVTGVSQGWCSSIWQADWWRIRLLWFIHWICHIAVLKEKKAEVAEFSLKKKSCEIFFLFSFFLDLVPVWHCSDFGGGRCERSLRQTSPEGAEQVALQFNFLSMWKCPACILSVTAHLFVAVCALSPRVNTAHHYAMQLSSRLGRNRYKEQFLFLYRSDQISLPQWNLLPPSSGTKGTLFFPFLSRDDVVDLVDAYQYEDNQVNDVDAFAREPYILHFKSHNTGQIWCIVATLWSFMCVLFLNVDMQLLCLGLSAACVSHAQV